MVDSVPKKNDGHDFQFLPPSAPSSKRPGKPTDNGQQQNDSVASAVQVTALEQHKPEDVEGPAPQPETCVAPTTRPEVKSDNEQSAVETNQLPPLPYTPPDWSTSPMYAYHLEVVKGGVVVDTVSLMGKAWFAVGRLPSCDIPMEHPSLSRYHLVVQHRDNGGVYVYDVGSTHGSILNKVPLKPRTFYRMKIGHRLQLGHSTRLLVLVGNDQAQQAEEEEAIAAMKQRTAAMAKDEALQPSEQYCAWGIDNDISSDPVEESEGQAGAVGDALLAKASLERSVEETGKEARWMRDPRKALAAFCDHEGLDLDYQVEQSGPGHARVFTCHIKLPLDAGEEELVAEGVAGRRKDAERAAAMDACRKLEAQGLFGGGQSQAMNVRERRRPRDSDSSDENDYLDRTGQVQQQKERRRLRAAKRTKQQTGHDTDAPVETAESLREMLHSVASEREQIITALKAWPTASGPVSSKKAAATDPDDSLDDYMNNLNTSLNVDGGDRLRAELADLEKRQERLLVLMAVADPKFNAESLKLGIGTSMTGRQQGPVPMADKVEPEKTSIAQAVLTNKVTSEKAVNQSVESLVISQSNSKDPLLVEASNSANEQTAEKETNQEVADNEASALQPPSETALPSSNKKTKPTNKKAKPGKRQYGAPTQAEALLAPVDDWLPPEGQTGDGTTSLNAKFDY